jgi:hypothetical protein
VDPVPDPVLLRKSCGAENRNLTSGSVARNSEHQTTEAVHSNIWKNKNMFNNREAVCQQTTFCDMSNYKYHVSSGIFSIFGAT